MPDWKVTAGDCVEQMAGMPEASVDAVVCDPPYGLEFMGKAWDAFRIDDTGTARHRGDAAGDHGAREGGTYNGDGRSKAKVSYGGGTRPTTSRCVDCGKRDQRRNPHEPCGEGVWRSEIIDPHAAPPTMLAFQEWSRLWALEAKRVLKPGGHLLAFGGTRTYHRLACAIEDAGFEIRDTIAWLYGSGFPKSLNLDGAFEGWGTALKPSHEPVVVARKPLAGTVAANVLAHGTGALNVDGCRIAGVKPQVTQGVNSNPSSFNVAKERRLSGDPTEGRWPANVVLDPEAARRLDTEGEWSRFFYVCGDESTRGEPTFDGAIPAPERSGSNSNTDGSGSRPTAQSHPDTTSITGTTTDSTTTSPTSNSSSEHGTRPTTADCEPPRSNETGNGCAHGAENGSRSTSTPVERTAPDRPCASPASANTSESGALPTANGITPTCASTASEPSRAFYCAKASSAERNAGLDGFEEKVAGGMSARADGSLDGHIVTSRNVHPTVKPIALMRWLVRLVTPPGGLVLDPFVGSGTTGCAAMLEGFRFVGIEREAEYAEIARARIEWWSRHPDGVEIVKALEAERTRGKAREAGQLGLFG